MNFSFKIYIAFLRLLFLCSAFLGPNFDCWWRWYGWGNACSVSKISSPKIYQFFLLASCIHEPIRSCSKVKLELWFFPFSDQCSCNCLSLRWRTGSWISFSRCWKNLPWVKVEWAHVQFTRPPGQRFADIHHQSILLTSQDFRLWVTPCLLMEAVVSCWCCF
jgi:hypothetical protein